MLKEIIENGRFSFQKGSLTWEDAIKVACQPLVEQKIIEPEYPGYIISNVHEFWTLHRKLLQKSVSLMLKKEKG